MSISDLSRPDVLDAYTQAALTGLLASGKCSNDLLPELAVRLAFNTLKEVENLWSKDSSRQKP
jgi:hypothetical protein